MMPMKKELSVAACCLALSFGPALAGCSQTSSAVQSEGMQYGIESGQNNNGVASQADQSNYQDGVYQGEGRGMHGPINIAITIAEGKITVDELTHSGETEGVGGKEAVEDGTFKAQIEEAQSADIDGITGATMTSGGVRSALEDALAQAK